MSTENTPRWGRGGVTDDVTPEPEEVSAEADETVDASEEVSDRIEIEEGKRYGLVLTQGGAPLEWRTVVGYGTFHPEIPTPVGGEGELSLERAQEADKDPGVDLKLVEVRADKQGGN